MESPAGKLISGSLLYALGDLLTVAVSGLLLLPLYLRYMTPAEYGTYAIVIALSNIASIVMALGTMTAFGRFYFSYRSQKREFEYLGSLWSFQLLLALGLTVLAATAGRPLWLLMSRDIPFEPYAFFVLVIAGLGFSSGVYLMWLRVQERPGRYVLVQLLGTGSFLLLVLVLLPGLNLGAVGTVSAATGAAVLMALLSLALLGSRVTWRPRLPYLKESLQFGGWTVVGAVAYFLLNKAQLFFLQHYQDLAAVGVFNLGQQLAGLLTMVGLAFGKAWQPVVFACPTRDQAARVIRQAARYMVAAMLYLAVGLSVLSTDLLHWLARPDYYGAGVIIRLAAIGSFLFVLTQLTGPALLYEKRADLAQAVPVLSAGVTLLLNWLWIPAYGMIGAAAALLVSFLMLAGVSLLLAQRVLPVAYDWAVLGKILVTGIALLALEWVLAGDRVSIWATLLRVGVLAAYPILLFATGVLNRGDFAALRLIGAKWAARLPTASPKALE